jgi:hypothetical protein
MNNQNRTSRILYSQRFYTRVINKMSFTKYIGALVKSSPFEENKHKESIVK